MQSDIVQRLEPILRRNGWGNVKEYSRHIPFMLEREGLCIVETAEIASLTEALRLQMEAKHKEAAEAKLWFQKAQEWKEALRAAEEREKALRHHWAALDKALTDNIIETDQPHRVRWEGEWHYGPLADAYFAMTSVVRKLARQALAGAKP